jgi:hypothetical protein
VLATGFFVDSAGGLVAGSTFGNRIAGGEGIKSGGCLQAEFQNTAGVVRCKKNTGDDTAQFSLSDCIYVRYSERLRLVILNATI